MNAKEFKQTRERHGKTRQEWAAQLEISYDSVVSYELGRTTIPKPVAKLIKIFEAVNKR